jgi:hypothetical protein
VTAAATAAATSVTAATATPVTTATTATTTISCLCAGYPGQAVRDQYGRRRQNRANSNCK